MTNARSNSEPSVDAISTWRTSLAIVIACLIVAVALADIQAVSLNPLVTTMMNDLGLSATQVGWILNGYTLVGATVSGVLARAGDTYGQRRVLIPISVVGLAGSILCALATSETALIAGRLMLGVGIPSVALVWGLIRPRATAPQVQRVAFWLASLSYSAIALAALLGGLLITGGLPWQTLFWANAAGYVLMLALLAASPESSAPRERAGRLDVIGGLGLGAWLLAVLLGLSWSGDNGYSDLRSLSAFAIAAILFAAWIMHQARTPHRLMAFHRDDARLMISGLTGAWSTYLAAAFMFTLLPITLQAPVTTGYGFGLDILGSTLPVAMFIPAAIIAQMFTGRLLALLGARILMTSATAVAALGFFGLAFVRPDYLMFFVWMFVHAVGLVIVLQTALALTAASGRSDNISVTVGIQYAGGALVSAVSTAIVVGLLDVGPDGTYAESVITRGFVYGGVAVALIGVAFAFLVPRRHLDRHAAVQPRNDGLLRAVKP